MDSVEVLHETLCQVGHAQPDGPVSVALQADHLIGAVENNTRSWKYFMDTFTSSRIAWILFYTKMHSKYYICEMIPGQHTELSSIVMWGQCSIVFQVFIVPYCILIHKLFLINSLIKSHNMHFGWTDLNEEWELK